jgi:hypothetical protein
MLKSTKPRAKRLTSPDKWFSEHSAYDDDGIMFVRHVINGFSIEIGRPDNTYRSRFVAKTREEVMQIIGLNVDRIIKRTSF